MNKEEIYSKLSEIIVDIKGEINFDKETPLIENGIFDSLELINYLTQIEEVFDLNISIDELVEKKLGKIDNLINYISENLS